MNLCDEVKEHRGVYRIDRSLGKKRSLMRPLITHAVMNSLAISAPHPAGAWCHGWFAEHGRAAHGHVQQHCLGGL